MHKFSNQDLRRLIIPLFLEQLLILLVGIADVFMVSFAGDSAVSGVSLVNMFVTFFIYVFTALASGGAVIVSQYIGRKDRENANHSAGQLLTLSLMISVTCTLVILFWNRQVLKLLFGSVDEHVMEACVIYQRIMALSFIPLAIYNTGAAICRSINRTGVTLKISIIANIINVAGNYAGIFIFRAGVAGVAWPSFLSILFSGVAVSIFCMSRKNFVYYSMKHIIHVDMKALKRILNVAIPNSIENGAFQMIKIVLSTITAMFGTAQIAANGIAQTIWSLASLMITVMGPVYLTVIGWCMGAGEIDEADYYFRRLMKITIITSTIWNTLIFALTPFIMSFYPLSREIQSLVVELVLIHNIFSSFVWPVGYVIPHGLRAAGDVRFSMLTSLASSLFVRLLFSYVFAVWFNLGVIGIAWAMICDWAARAVIFWLRYRQGEWKLMHLV